MGDPHLPYADEVRRRVLEGPGVTEPSLRQAVFARAQGSTASSSSALEGALGLWVDRVARDAWNSTPEELKALGLSDDAAFELTLVAALGAAQFRLQRGLELLEAAP
jgi:hypothetical protein